MHEATRLQPNLLTDCAKETGPDETKSLRKTGTYTGTYLHSYISGASQHIFFIYSAN